MTDPHQELATIRVSGTHRSLILNKEGHVYCCGDNRFCQIIPGLPQAIVIPVKLPIENIVDIASGATHCLAITSNKEVLGWGRNDHGQLSMSHDNPLLCPTPIELPCLVSRVFAGLYCSFAITADKRVLKWGNEQDFHTIGPVGVVQLENYDDNVIMITEEQAVYTYCQDSVASITNLSAVSVAVGQGFFLAVDNGGHLWSWGVNNYGQLGLGHTEYMETPQKVPMLSLIKAVAAGSFFSVALTHDGQVLLWGWNQAGTLGLPEEVNISPVTYLKNGCSAVFALAKSLFVVTEQCILGCGWNSCGQLGLGCSDHQPVPVIVFGSEVTGRGTTSIVGLQHMFNDVIKAIMLRHLEWLRSLLGIHHYIECHFLQKFSISKRFRSLARHVVSLFGSQRFVQNCYSILDCETLTRVNIQPYTSYTIPSENSVVKEVLLVSNDLDNHQGMLASFLNVQSITIRPNLCLTNAPLHCTKVLNLKHLKALKFLNLDFPTSIVSDLPFTLVELSLGLDVRIELPRTLSELTNLRSLGVFDYEVSASILEGVTLLPSLVTSLSLKLKPKVVIGRNVVFPSLKQFATSFNIFSSIRAEQFPLLCIYCLCSFSHGCRLQKYLNKYQLLEACYILKRSQLLLLTSFPWCVLIPKAMDSVSLRNITC
ncbi:hypothetical protein P9112_004930 [Eukaryota sp. TZLM1-RC]